MVALVGLNASVLQSMYGIRADKAIKWIAPIEQAFRLAEIDTPYRQAAFLAQIGHESGRLKYVREIWGPSAQQRRYEPGTTLAKRLGNTEPGDGARYMGRGLIQTTGRTNYAMTTVRLREFCSDVPDFEADPKQLENLIWAALSAALFWRVKKLNKFADMCDIVTMTKRINGGTNGLADRQMLFARGLMLSS